MTSFSRVRPRFTVPSTSNGSGRPAMTSPATSSMCALIASILFVVGTSVAPVMSANRM